VTLLEKNEWVGGKAAVHHENGFRFDMGPTILTLPSVLHRIFREANRNLEDYMHLVALDPQWRCFFEDGGVLDLVTDIAKMRSNLETFSPKANIGEGYERFMQISKRLHEVSNKFFFWRSVGGISDTMEVGGAFSATVLKDVLSLRMGTTVAGLVRSCVPDQRAAQMIDHFTQYVGSSPEASPAVLCGIAHMQTQEGVWYPIGGTRAVPQALAKLAGELGVEIKTQADVASIDTDGKSVQGVTTTDGQKYKFDAIVSNCDAVRTHRELIKGTASEKRFEKRR
jgi:phytoene desaturase